VSHLRRHIDDRTARSSCDHPARDRLSCEISAPHVQIHDGVEIFHRHIGERIWPVGAGIVYEDVIWLPRVNRRVKRRHVSDIKSKRIRR
jgi:hypothetical protein